MERDPLSVRYDGYTRRVLVAAIRAYSQRRGVVVFVATPGPWLRDTDPGGRTRYERAFTRSAYYHVVQVPRQLKTPQEWSLRLTWGQLERRGSRYGRQVTVRMYAKASGSRYVRTRVSRAQRYVENPALRSTAAIDQAS